MTASFSQRERTVFGSWGVLAIRQILVALVTTGGLLGLALLLAPADYALYGYAASLLLIAAMIGDLGIGAGVIRNGESEERLRGGLGLQLVVWVPFCACIAAAAIGLGAYGLGALEACLLMLAFFLVALQTLPTAVLEHRNAFRSIAAVEVSQRVVFVGAALLLALLWRDGAVVAISAALAGLLGCVSVLRLTRWRWRPRLSGARGFFLGFSSHWWQGRMATQLNYAVYPLLGGVLFTQHEVGLIVWAVAVSSVPAQLAPLAARAVFPTLVGLDADSQMAVFRRLFRAVALAGLPPVAALLALAEPITVGLFGHQWRDAVVLVQLGCATTVLGIALTPVVPLLFLVLEAAHVKRILVGWAAASWIGTLLLAPFLSYRAPAVAQTATALAVLVLVDRRLAAARGYSLVADLRAGLMGLAAGALLGFAFAGYASTVVRTLGLAAAVTGVAATVTLLLSGGFRLRTAAERLRPLVWRR